MDLSLGAEVDIRKGWKREQVRRGRERETGEEEDGQLKTQDHRCACMDDMDDTHEANLEPQGAM